MDVLSNYEPSVGMLNAMKADFSDESLAAANAVFGLYLNSREVDYDNVCTVLRILLSIEDITAMQPYSELIHYGVKFIQGSVYFTQIKPGINIKNVLKPQFDEVVLLPTGQLDFLSYKGILALMPHPYEQLRCGESKHRHVIKINNVIDGRVELNFNDIHQKSKAKCYQYNLRDLNYYDAIFRSPRIPVRLMLHALQALEKSPDIRRYLFPISDLKKQQTAVPNTPNTLTLLNKSIAANAEQLQAVRQIVNGPNPLAPHIVFGPPGTGKTTTIVEAIVQLYMKGNNRILVTAGSNSACDTIALRLYESLQLLPGKPVEKLKRFVSTSYNGNVHSKLRQICISLTNKDLGKLDDFQIIVATLCSVGRIYTYSAYSRGFSYIFIDEAAASTEAEALMGIVGIKQSSSHVILSGDHKQLGAVIKSERAAELGLVQSLMERLLLNKLYEVDASGNYDQTLQTRLRRNYRSHPEIVGIYNKLYYNSELIPVAPPAMVNQAANWSVLPNGKYPILFQAAMGEIEREAHSTSSFNSLEIRVACWMVFKLLCDGLGDGVKVKQEDIGIVTPYLAQCKRLKDKLYESQQGKVEVGTVESYQGREKMIIIASMVSSFKSSQFLTNPRRVNVLLSRAKSLLIIIGNPDTLSENEDFKYIINQCKLNENFLTQGQVEADIKKSFESKCNEYRKMYEENRKKEREIENEYETVFRKLAELGINRI